MKRAGWNSSALDHVPPKHALITHVVNGKNYWRIFDQWIVRVRGAQQHRQQTGLPVMAMDRIRRPNVLRHLNRRAAKLGVAFGIVRKIAPAAAVDSIAIKILRVFHKEI